MRTTTIPLVIPLPERLFFNIFFFHLGLHHPKCFFLWVESSAIAPTEERVAANSEKGMGNVKQRG